LPHNKQLTQKLIGKEWVYWMKLLRLKKLHSHDLSYRKLSDFSQCRDAILEKILKKYYHSTIMKLGGCVPHPNGNI
jgi:hypothetical protein